MIDATMAIAKKTAGMGPTNALRTHRVISVCDSVAATTVPEKFMCKTYHNNI
jgi:hypothetical protein